MTLFGAKQAGFKTPNLYQHQFAQKEPQEAAQIMLGCKKFLVLVATEIDLAYGVPTETLTREHFNENPMATWETHSDFIR